MAFRFVGRIDDDWQWTWDASTTSRKAQVTDKFERVYPRRLPRGAPSGRLGSRATSGTRWAITAGASWDEGDLLRLNDPDNDDFDLRELANVNETVIAVAAGAVSGGLALGPETDYPPIINVTAQTRWAVTDVNGTVPASGHVGQEAVLDNSSGWQIDLAGSGDVEVTAVDTNRNLFIVRFLAAVIQDNPGD